MRFSAAGKTRPVHNPYVVVTHTSSEYCEVYGSISLGPQRPTNMVITVQNRSYGKRELYYVVKPTTVGGVMSTGQFSDGVLNGLVGKASTGQVSKVFQATYANNPGAWYDSFEIEIREGSATGTLLAVSSPGTVAHFGARVWMQNNTGGTYQNTYVNYGPSEKEFVTGIGNIERQIRWVIYWPSTNYYYGSWVGGGGSYWEAVASTVDASGNTVTGVSNGDFTTYWGSNNVWDSLNFAHYNGTSLVRDGLNEGLEYFRISIRLNSPFSGQLVTQGPICSIATNTAASSN